MYDRCYQIDKNAAFLDIKNEEKPACWWGLKEVILTALFVSFDNLFFSVDFLIGLLSTSPTCLCFTLSLMVFWDWSGKI